MDDIGLKLTFGDTNTAVAFARELQRIDPSGRPFRVATFDQRLNFDAETLLLVLKIAGASAKAITAFIILARETLKVLQKPSMKIESEGREIQLEAATSDVDIRKLSDALLPPKR